MKYCRSCGAVMEEQDIYCQQCGKADQKAGLRYRMVSFAKKEPSDKLFCELAYTGFLFWLPLVFSKHSKYSINSANQGLWALIAATGCCTAIRLAGTVNMHYAGSFLGIILSGIYALLFIMFLSFMLFLMWKCLRNVYRIHKDEKIERILFFDKAAIIR